MKGLNKNEELFVWDLDEFNKLSKEEVDQIIQNYEITRDGVINWVKLHLEITRDQVLSKHKPDSNFARTKIAMYESLEKYLEKNLK